MLAENIYPLLPAGTALYRGSRGIISGAVKPAAGDIHNPPDDRWQRTVYDMDGNKIWEIIRAACLLPLLALAACRENLCPTPPCIVMRQQVEVCFFTQSVARRGDVLPLITRR